MAQGAPKNVSTSLMPNRECLLPNLTLVKPDIAAMGR
jgi:hypothetical protein